MNRIPLLTETSNPNPQEQEPQRGRMQEIDLGIHTIRSHWRRYVGKDMMTDLKYPFNDNTIPVWSVPIYAVLLPIIVFVCFYIKRTCVYDLHHSILGLLFTVLINGGVVCHGEPGEVKEGHKSFPSGHTSCSASCSLLSSRLASWGYLVWDDYWHHWQDVFAGGLIGLFVTAFCYRQFYPNPYHEEGWGPYAYFIAAQERGSQQNGDAMRTMSLQAEPRSLENMESGTSTAPR
uniref:Phosphatidic acid phosphatase type 2/haloperoxidase domain-containing protein n=1 Tax=Brassica oleracea var. oleracea TaxID=109376 RepID=A0A0D3DA66_BRAOL